MCIVARIFLGALVLGDIFANLSAVHSCGQSPAPPHPRGVLLDSHLVTEEVSKLSHVYETSFRRLGALLYWK